MSDKGLTACRGKESNKEHLVVNGQAKGLFKSVLFHKGLDLLPNDFLVLDLAVVNAR